MMNKKGLQIIAWIFAGLVVITLAVTFFGNGREKGNFTSMLTDFDSSEITKIQINSPNAGSFTLQRSGEDNWELASNENKYKAEAGSVNSLLSQTSTIKVKRVVSKDKESWKKYSVNDSLGTRLKMYAEDELLADLVVGRMTFSNAQPRNPYQRQPDAFTFIRPEDGSTVYSTEGMLSMELNQGPDYFRNNTVVQVNSENLNRISFNYPSDSSFVLSKSANTWMAGTVTADSSQTAGYLNSLQNFRNRSFADISNIEGESSLFDILLEGDNMEAVTIKAWPAGAQDEYFVTSSQDEGTVFLFQKSVFDRLFRGKDYFLEKES